MAGPMGIGVTLFIVGGAVAETTELPINVPEPTLRVDDHGYTHVEIPGWSSLGAPGAPALPSRTVWVLLPRDSVVDAVTVTGTATLPLPGHHLVYPGQAGRPMCGGESPPFTEPDPGVYMVGLEVPTEPGRADRTRSLRGYLVQPVLVSPVIYRTSDMTLAYSPTVLVSVSTRPDAGATEPPRLHYRGLRRDSDWVRPLVVNPEALAGYPQLSTRQTGADAQYLIITSEALAACPGADNLQRLAADKQSRGLSTLLATVEEIYSSTTGVDDADKVRNFIKDKYTNNGTEYVLLAGDADGSVVGGETEPPIVPVRKLWCSMDFGTDEIASDLYYAGLDGDFNAGGDAQRWGEPEDDVDMLAEVFVGRAPVDNCTEVANFVRKTLRYQAASGCYLHRVAMVGEWLWDPDPAYPNWGAEYLRCIVDPAPWTDWWDCDSFDTLGLVSDSFFEPSTLYDYDLLGAPQQNAWGPDEMMALVNDEPHVIDQLGHALNNYSSRVYTHKLEAEIDNTQYALWYTQGCYSGSFDNQSNIGTGTYWEDSFAEHLTLGEHGAFAAIMNTRIGLGGHSNHHNRYFWDALLRGISAHIGEMHAYSRERLASYIETDQNMRWALYQTTLFGDPELSLHDSLTTTVPMIGLPDGPIRFDVALGLSMPPAHLRLRNHGCGTMTWLVSSDEPWLTVAPAAGTAPAELSLHADPSVLSPGLHRANLTFTSTDAANSPQSLAVEVTVVSAPAVVAEYRATAPVVDGVLAAGEYDGATVLALGPGPPPAATAYLLHDGSALYLGLEVVADYDLDVLEEGDGNRQRPDRLDIFVDTDGDGTWPSSPGDEGVASVSADGVQTFTPLYLSGADEQQAEAVALGGVDHAFGAAAGHWQIEVRLALSESPVRREVGEAFGLYLSYADHVYRNNWAERARWPSLAGYDPRRRFLGKVTIEAEQLSAEPARLTFEVAEGEERSVIQTLTVTDTWDQQVQVELLPTADWLMVDQDTGVTPMTREVWVETRLLPPGLATASLLVTAAGETEPSLALPVEVEVIAGPATTDVVGGCRGCSSRGRVATAETSLAICLFAWRRRRRGRPGATVAGPGAGRTENVTRRGSPPKTAATVFGWTVDGQARYGRGERSRYL